MCTLRALFVLREEEILLSKRFPIVEKKVSLLSKEYHPLPNDHLLLSHLLKIPNEGHGTNANRNTKNRRFILFTKATLGLNRVNQLEFNPNKELSILENDSDEANTEIFDSQKSKWFHFMLDIDGKRIWPCLFFRNKKYSVYLFPFITETFDEGFQRAEESEKNFMLSKSFCFQGCLSFSRSLLSYLQTDNFTKGELLKLFELQNILSHLIPYGTIYQDDFSLIKEIIVKKRTLQNETSLNTYLKNPDSTKLPQFKPFFIDGSSEIELVLEEEIASYQFGNENIRDYHLVNGSINCTALLPQNPEITLSLQGITSEIYRTFRMSTPGKIYKTDNIQKEGLKMIFYPQNKPFQLCCYNTESNIGLPLQGSFQKKEVSPDVIKILVSLQISKEASKKIEQLDVEINFKEFHRISLTNLNNPVGIVRRKKKDKTLLWQIDGKSLQQNQQEVSLTGTIYLRRDGESFSERSILHDKFQIPKNEETNSGDILFESGAAKVTESNLIMNVTENREAKKKSSGPRKLVEASSLLAENYCLPEDFVEIHLKLSDFLLTEIDINPSMINLYPPQKPKIIIRKKSQSQNYYIFNILNSDLLPFEIRKKGEEHETF